MYFETSMISFLPCNVTGEIIFSSNLICMFGHSNLEFQSFYECLKYRRAPILSVHRFLSLFLCAYLCFMPFKGSFNIIMNISTEKCQSYMRNNTWWQNFGWTSLDMRNGNFWTLGRELYFLEDCLYSNNFE